MHSRRSIAARVIARARERGMPIDDDVEYMALVEHWIEGEIDIQDMRQRYIQLLARRSADRRARRGNPSFSEGFESAPVLRGTADATIDGTFIDEDKAAGIPDAAADGTPRDGACPTV